MWTPKDNYDDRSNICVQRIVRRYPESVLDRFGLWASRNAWFQGLGPSRLRDNLATALTIDVNTALDHFFSTKTVRFHPTDKPWITAHIKELIKKRPQAFHSSNA